MAQKTHSEYINDILIDEDTLEIISDEQVLEHSVLTKEWQVKYLKKDNKDPANAEIIAIQYFIFNEFVYERA